MYKLWRRKVKFSRIATAFYRHSPGSVINQFRRAVADLLPRFRAAGRLTECAKRNKRKKYATTSADVKVADDETAETQG